MQVVDLDHARVAGACAPGRRRVKGPRGGFEQRPPASPRSSGDLIAATLTFFVVRLGGRPADPEHPYGHRRAQNLGALGEAAILLAGGVVVAVEAIRHLASGANAPAVH